MSEATQLVSLGIAWAHANTFRFCMQALHESDTAKTGHTLTHQNNRFELFLVPIGPDNDGILYEAIFN